MPKAKKKNANYNNYHAPKQTEKQPVKRESTLGYGLPGWLTAVSFLLLVGALILYWNAETLPAWANILSYFLTGIPATIFTVGQNNRRREGGSRAAGVLTVVFGLIAAIYLFSGMLLLFQSFGA